MIDTFGGVQDDWITNDLTSWLDINSFYLGVPDVLRNCSGESVLVTTKQHPFATDLARHVKVDVIVDQMKNGVFQAENVYFFEDWWPTLSKF
eukprot:10918468-Ditylum_brightwellii.AAC.1